MIRLKNRISAIFLTPIAVLCLVTAGCAKEEPKPKVNVTPAKDVYQETDPQGKPIINEKANEKQIANPETLTVSSTAFADGQRLPDRFSRSVETGGSNISPPIQWEPVPAGTESIAFIMVDTAPIAGNWVHWIAINIPPDTTSITEGASLQAMPPNCVELNNSFRFKGYGGPQPPAGSGEHAYEIRVYAMNTRSLELGPKTSYEEFNTAVKGKAYAIGKITGTFSR